METKTTIQFDVLDTQMLASIEGGTASAGEVCTLAGAMIGSLVAPRSGTFFIIGAIGIVLNVPISEVLVLSVGSVFFELLIHLLTHNKKRGNISFELCFNRYKQFIKKILVPTFFLLLLSIIFVVIDGYKSSSVLFYTHIFVVLFTVGYIICSNNIELHISKKE